MLTAMTEEDWTVVLRVLRGQEGQALGRSRGGFSTKIHLKTDFGGLPLAFHLTGGEARDSRISRHFSTSVRIPTIPARDSNLKAATIPIEGGPYCPVGTFMGSQRW
jgi:hypothetical protein